MKEYILGIKKSENAGKARRVFEYLENLLVKAFFRQKGYIFDSLEGYYNERTRIKSDALIQIPQLTSDEGLIINQNLDSGSIIFKDKNRTEPIRFDVARGSGRLSLDEESWKIARNLMPNEEVEIAFWQTNIEGRYLLNLFRVYKKNDGDSSTTGTPPRGTGNTLEEVLEVLK